MTFKIIKRYNHIGDNMNKYEEMYFHGLSGNVIVFNADSFVINTSLERLEKIIITGGLYSRNKLREYNITYDHKPVENGNDYISICVKNPNEDEFTGYNEGFESAFINYVYFNKIALVIDKNIETKYEFRNKTGTFMLPGERQVKDGISFCDIIGITIMFDDEFSMKNAVNKVGELLSKYNLSIPLLDRNLKIIQKENIITF